MRPNEKSPWSDAHIALKKLWDERIAPTGITQEEFGEKYGIGTQTMVSQYLNGARPLNYDAAAKFAEGFGCSIQDICPEMAKTIHAWPVLRRSLRRRRAAVLAAIALLPALLSPTPADATGVHNFSYVKSLRIMSNWLRRLLGSSQSVLGLAA
jgi:transcriptional regulator with XRE-family HTH domain